MRYTAEDKTKALLLLKRYNFNKNKVCKELSIRYETITSWQNSDLGKKVLGKENKTKAPQTAPGIEKQLDRIITETTIEFKKNEASLDDLIFEVKKVILERIKSLVPGIKNPYALAQLAATMKDYEVKSDAVQNNNTFNQFIQNQIINEKSTDTDQEY